MVVENKRYLVSVIGPTAVGKTSVSIELARHYKSEIISADSRQFFRELEIGTAKPSPEELERVPHHFINSHSINDPVDVGRYEKEAIQLLEKLLERHTVVFLVGGSGLYVDALVKGLDDLPPGDPSLREKLNEKMEAEGLDPLRKQLEQLDPAYFSEVDLNNPQRIIRALEVSIASGRPFSSFRKGRIQKRDFEHISIGLDMQRELLYERIDHRMDLMIDAGLFEEAEKFYPLKHLNALQTVGYKEIFGFLDGAYDREEAIRLLKRNSRRYAKRQLTWFRRNPETTWFRPNQFSEMLAHINRKLSERTKAEK